MFTTKELLSTDKKIRLTVGVMEDGFVVNPREQDGVVEFTTREHRYYDLPKEFSFDWDAYDEGDMKEIEKMDKDYYVFFLDCYDHWNMVWSFMGDWIQCRFDTAKRAGLMRVSKSAVKDRIEASKLVKEEIKRYNQRLSGEIYEWRLERLVKWHSEDNRERVEREYLDSCGWYYDEDDALKDGKEMCGWINFLDDDMENKN